MILELMHKNTQVLTIDMEKGIVLLHVPEMIPFELDVKEEPVLSNILHFQTYCSRRMLTLDRKYAKEILNYFGHTQSTTDADRYEVVVATKGLSLNDCFWIRKQGEQYTWEEVNLYDNSLSNVVFDVALFGSPTVTNEELLTPDLSTDGKAAKAWRRVVNKEENMFYLLKGDKDNSVNRETESSQILKKLGLPVIVHEKKQYKDADVSVSKCFTDKDVSFVRASRYADYCERNGKFFVQELKPFEKDFDLMNLADYLVGNTDEHADNWGFLYNNNMQLLGLSPIMDLDHAFLGSNLTICTPELLRRGRVSQLQAAKDVVEKYPDAVDYDADLSEFTYGDFVMERLQVLKTYLEEKGLIGEDIRE